MFFGGGVTEEGRRAAAVSTRTLCRKYADLGVSREMIAFVKISEYLHKVNLSNRVVRGNRCSKPSSVTSPQRFIVIWHLIYFENIICFWPSAKCAVPPSPGRRLWQSAFCFSVKQTLVGEQRAFSWEQCQQLKLYRFDGI